MSNAAAHVSTCACYMWGRLRSHARPARRIPCAHGVSHPPRNRDTPSPHSDNPDTPFAGAGMDEYGGELVGGDKFFCRNLAWAAKN